MVDWANPADKISNHFSVKEACWLPSWGKLATPSPDEQSNILKAAKVMEDIRLLLNMPISIHCWLRPQDYNAFIKGATHSMHIVGLAVDWDCGENCDVTRTRMIPLLKTLNIRMEHQPGPWVHIDLKPVASETERYFIP